jgi:membrane-bound acyltransferase YfiQ involved in biofilm formation
MQELDEDFPCCTSLTTLRKLSKRNAFDSKSMRKLLLPKSEILLFLILISFLLLELIIFDDTNGNKMIDSNNKTRNQRLNLSKQFIVKICSMSNRNIVPSLLYKANQI